MSTSGFPFPLGDFPAALNRGFENLERSGRFAAADIAGEIGAEYEAVRLLVEQLLDDLDDLPASNTVSHVTGAKTGSAAAFSTPLATTMLRASAATRALRTEVDETMAAVRLTLIDLSSSDATARGALNGLASEVAAAGGLPTGAAPTSSSPAPGTPVGGEPDADAPSTQMRG